MPRSAPHALGEVAGRAEALRRWAVLRPHLEDGLALADAAAADGVPYRTAQRWLARYRTHGLTGLARAPRTDRPGMTSGIGQLLDGDNGTAGQARFPNRSGRRNRHWVEPGLAAR